MAAIGWGNEFHVADGSWFRQMVEGPIDLTGVLGLEDAPPRFWYCFQTSLLVWPALFSSLRCHIRTLLESSLWHYFELPISLPYFLTFGNKFSIKYFTWCLIWCMHAWYEKYDLSCSKMPNWSYFITKVCTIKPWEKTRKPFLIPIHFSLFFQIFLSSHPILIIFYSNSSSFFFTKSLFFFHFFLASCFFDTFLLFQTKSFFSPFLFSISKYFLKKMNKTLIFQFFDFFLQIKYHIFFERETKSKTLFLHFLKIQISIK